MYDLVVAAAAAAAAGGGGGVFLQNEFQSLYLTKRNFYINVKFTPGAARRSNSYY